MFSLIQKNYGYIFLILLAACGAKSRNILMIPRIEEKGIVKIYLDREGDLYPPEVHITPFYFFLEDKYGQKRKRTKKNEYASLRSAITERDSVTTQQLKEKYKLAELDYDPKDYDLLQTTIQKNYVKQLEENFAINGSRHVVFLIHGFNDPNPDASFYLLRRSIYKYATDKPTIVEVFWDGLNARGDNPILSNIWGKAQTNSAKVGLGLRKIITRIPSNTKITILTHSLGASVATHLLFNPLKWPKSFQETLEERYHSDSLSTPKQNNITLAMLAPAIPGTSTFKGLKQTVPEKNNLNLTKIVIGFNRYDYAVNKGRVVPASWFGSTTLGCDYHFEVSKTIDIIRDSVPTVTCAPINFSYRINNIDTLSKKLKKTYRQKEHDIIKYESNEHFDAFMKAVFNK
jgi:hypothetical protein